jgi:hypothetical protein
VGPHRDMVSDRLAALTRGAHLAVMGERGNGSGTVALPVWASAAESGPRRKNPFCLSKSISKYSRVKINLRKYLQTSENYGFFLEVVWNILDTFFIGHFDQRSTKFK